MNGIYELVIYRYALHKDSIDVIGDELNNRPLGTTTAWVSREKQD